MMIIAINLVTQVIFILSVVVTLSEAKPWCGSSPETRAVRGKRLMLILLDGFRWDYLDMFTDDEVPGFTELRSSSVQADYLQPDFPANSLDNYYTLMTGLHAGYHGILDNYMYDPFTKEEFQLGVNPEHSHPYWWKGGDPLWTTAERQGKKVWMYFWRGCNVEIRGIRPTRCVPYLGNENPSLEKFTEAINASVDAWSSEEDGPDTVAIYFENIDKQGHLTGAGSEIVKQAILEVDKVLANLFIQLKSRKSKTSRKPLSEEVNLMIFSDHGMKTKVPDHAIRIEDYVNLELMEKMTGYPYDTMFGLWPKDVSATDMILESLEGKSENMVVYRKEEVPESYHWNMHYRVPPIVVLAKPGYVLLRPEQKDADYMGYHGYSNDLEEMRGVFFGLGPDFQVGKRVPGLKNVNLYQLMCHLNDIKASPNHGEWGKVQSMLSGCDRVYYS